MPKFNLELFKTLILSSRTIHSKRRKLGMFILFQKYQFVYRNKLNSSPIRQFPSFSRHKKTSRFTFGEKFILFYNTRHKSWNTCVIFLFPNVDLGITVVSVLQLVLVAKHWGRKEAHLSENKGGKSENSRKTASVSTICDEYCRSPSRRCCQLFISSEHIFDPGLKPLEIYCYWTVSNTSRILCLLTSVLLYLGTFTVYVFRTLSVKYGLCI